jgi:hypothetical protein
MVSSKDTIRRTVCLSKYRKLTSHVAKIFKDHLAQKKLYIWMMCQDNMERRASLTKPSSTVSLADRSGGALRPSA